MKMQMFFPVVNNFQAFYPASVSHHSGFMVKLKNLLQILSEKNDLILFLKN